jgi:hypothetical protein
MRILKEMVWSRAFRKTTMNRDQVQVEQSNGRCHVISVKQSKTHSEFQVLIFSEEPPTQRGESLKKGKIRVTEKERIKAQELYT